MTSARAGPALTPSDARFATTHWSMVVAAGSAEADCARQALAELCQSYWYPLYAFIRRRGYQVDDARDLTQEFFSRLIEKQYLQTADRRRGRFRTFLLTALKRFLQNERKRARVQKRGGGRPLVSLDFDAGEARFRLEPVDESTPEKQYERRWALAVLENVFQQLEANYARRGREDLFGHLKAFITAASQPPYSQLAEELGVSEGAVKVAVHRLRQQYRQTLRGEIAHTVLGDDDIDDELQQLMRALGDG